MFDVQFLGFITASIVIIVVPGVDFALVTRQVVRYGRSAGLITLAGLVVGGLVHATLATVGLSALLVSSPRLYNVLRVVGALYLLYLAVMILWSTRPRRSPVEPPAVPVTTAARSEDRMAAGSDGREPTPPGGRSAPAVEPVGSTGTALAGDGPAGKGLAGDASTDPALPGGEAGQLTRIRRRAFGLGVASNLLNPKVIIFYVSFVPQFVRPGPGASARTAVLAGTFLTLAIIWWICYIMLINRIHTWLTRPRVTVVVERLTGVTLLVFAAKIALGY